MEWKRETEKERSAVSIGEEKFLRHKQTFRKESQCQTIKMVRFSKNSLATSD